MPPSEDNWVFMNQHEYLEFLKTPEGKCRKNNFGQLDAIDEDDVIYVIECGNKDAKRIRSEKDEHDYLFEQQVTNNVCLLSLDSLFEERVDKENLSPHEKIYKSEDDVVAETLKNMDIDTLHIAIASLDDLEKMIIEKLFFDEKTVSSRELSSLLGMPVMTLHKKKMRIFKKIKKFF